MPTYAIWTIGCQMNKADSARLIEALEDRGYAPAPALEEADVVILNTCVVRESAERRVEGRLNSLKGLKRRRPEVFIGVMGCFVGADRAALARRFPHADAFFTVEELDDFLALVPNLATLLPSLAGQQESSITRSASSPRADAVGITAYVPIIYGCDNFCSYCIVPYRRGRERSRPPAEIVADVASLVSRGVREVTLLGQNVDSYGHDLPDRLDLADLLAQVHEVPDLWRIRFLTSHPKDMSDRLIDAVAALPKVCEAINLPVQAGDDDVLHAMRRGYTVAHYRDLVARMRARIPDLALTTDVIVGFPGETDQQFQHTYDLLAQTRFDQVHVAAYSPRSGTAAARLPDDVQPEEKERRRVAVEELQTGIARTINATYLGRTVEVLVEDRHQGQWRGRTRTDKLVFFADEEDWPGRLARVEIIHAGPWSLRGQLQT
ncbi:MAG: tRNA (N6-isopentenyl adenosine(37)-C2)-methylthiotransferase MiaB [Chloroflexi bacterium]|nr:tRNA (N6-isopentenyl adenosine(37)-C2)-methylthiotransferase MiaB [Chloroflexota bacterium]MBU1747286.1 tRNA (N6-isopentenyl adenosine(37)-C2)-methylthiotransferase MiaB [Chloroflexota bacterium]MBU1879589.1 tRNA (N6-isopentenyl adenosine(37)-C2)-methylthiotransferase MiaB [Chloroflexota bacterium]